MLDKVIDFQILNQTPCINLKAKNFTCNAGFSLDNILIKGDCVYVHEKYWFIVGFPIIS